MGKAQAVGSVPIALRGLRTVHRPPAVYQQLLRRGNIQGLKDAGPIDGMRRSENVHTDDMHIGWPATLIDHGRVVIRQGVEPNVRHKVMVERQFNTPGQSRLRTRDAEVVQGFLEELENLLAPMGGVDEVGVVLEVLD